MTAEVKLATMADFLSSRLKRKRKGKHRGLILSSILQVLMKDEKETDAKEELQSNNDHH